MNKQELIDYCNALKESKGRFINCIDVDRIIDTIKQLDEPETGHADEAPRYLKNILARLRELPLHNREVWLKVIMSEFKQDFSHAKWREGYEQGKLEGMAEREKVKVPQCVADVIEGAREQSPELEDALHYTWGNGTKEFTEWYNKKSNRDLFARAWLDGYEVEEEKRYLVKVKGMSEENTYLTFRFGHTWMLSNFEECEEFRLHHTRKELEEAGFGWVFSCEGIEMEEVE